MSDSKYNDVIKRLEKLEHIINHNIEYGTLYHGERDKHPPSVHPNSKEYQEWLAEQKEK